MPFVPHGGDISSASSFSSSLLSLFPDLDLDRASLLPVPPSLLLPSNLIAVGLRTLPFAEGVQLSPALSAPNETVMSLDLSDHFAWNSLQWVSSCF